MKPETKRALLVLARKTLEAELTNQPAPALDPGAAKDAAEKRGVFVSVHERTGDHDLRGCIGTFSFDTPLEANLRKMAIACGTQDPRFPPVTPAELAQLRFEISVMTPPTPIKPEDVVVGKHGLVIGRGPFRGVLLPQVPVEWKWTREEFLAHTCRKAGLDSDAWKQAGTTIEAFTAEVFAEDE